MQGSISQMLRSVPNTQTEAPVTVAKHSLDELAAQIKRGEKRIADIKATVKSELDEAERELAGYRKQLCNALLDAKLGIDSHDWEQVLNARKQG